MHDSEGNDDWYLCAIADFDGSVHSGYVPAAYLHIIEDESANEMMEDAMTDGETPDDVLPSMPESIAEADEEDDDDSYLPPPPPEPMETLEEVPSVPSLPELPAPPPSEPLKPLEEVPSVPSVPQLPTPPVLPETPSTPTIPVIAIAAGLASAAQANLRAKKNQSEPGKKAVMVQSDLRAKIMQYEPISLARYEYANAHALHGMSYTVGCGV
ncbi:hypothetical protein SARC_06649 [Sphaeroforma arctica JP610]|uniref:SH3 domain-containing protein n=1 Tax=Sphaeroforma arctica JP610 TaxID=667725 RepID=A0A0L0FYF9_9EUKA|nr:hypothetical protein SARC_06649 [Sphaeroforma arctica JP610]KNC81003.1 hypothetical protein SARC_06649 [Sphaeroforma arctica JP610]|eukprot:XP_014154905.1 hypothetical protein SARC_06649 [Sphaeroforma arctica JP610]